MRFTRGNPWNRRSRRPIRRYRRKFRRHPGYRQRRYRRFSRGERPYTVTDKVSVEIARSGSANQVVQISPILAAYPKLSGLAPWFQQYQIMKIIVTVIPQFNVGAVGAQTPVQYDKRYLSAPYHNPVIDQTTVTESAMLDLKRCKQHSAFVGMRRSFVPAIQSTVGLDGTGTSGADQTNSRLTFRPKIMNIEAKSLSVRHHGGIIFFPAGEGRYTVTTTVVCRFFDSKNTTFRF